MRTQRFTKYSLTRLNEKNDKGQIELQKEIIVVPANERPSSVHGKFILSLEFRATVTRIDTKRILLF